MIYLTFEQAQDLVKRIAERTQNFNYTMTENEKEAMAELLSDVGVETDDLIDVSRLADNYAINAEIVDPEQVEKFYSENIKEDYLFSWEEDGTGNRQCGTHYCISW